MSTGSHGAPPQLLPVHAEAACHPFGGLLLKQYLELHAFQVRSGVGLSAETIVRIEQTIELLGLCDPDCCDIRQTFAEDYWNRHISLNYLERKAPFVARELRRQARLNPEYREPSLV
jgi:hypothetical protein